ncbi:MAG: hypothetical protein N3B21_15385 [Clostridia bacterium]|nr:hypothetical protein [Clostridia bacterium]
MGRFEKIISLMLVPLVIIIVMKVRADNWNKSYSEEKWVLAHYLLPLLLILGIGYSLYYKLREIYYSKKKSRSELIMLVIMTV